MRRTVAALSLLLLAGCFQVEQSIELQPDLSGTAGFRFAIDFEPFIAGTAQFARELEGKSGPVTEEELAKAKAEFRRQPLIAPTREEVAQSLPSGVRLVDYTVADRELGMTSDFRFAFDRLFDLVGVQLPAKGEGRARTLGIDSPFEGLEVAENGKLLTIRAKAQNPAEPVREEAAEATKNEAAEKLLDDAFAKMSVVFRITAPFAVVSHNATRREGQTLIWEYDAASFEKLQKSGADPALRVTYRR